MARRNKDEMFAPVLHLPKIYSPSREFYENLRITVKGVENVL